jgi:hypothetical protein
LEAKKSPLLDEVVNFPQHMQERKSKILQDVDQRINDEIRKSQDKDLISQVTVPLSFILAFDVLLVLIVFLILGICSISLYILPLRVLAIFMMVPNICFVLYVFFNAHNPIMVLCSSCPDWPLNIFYCIAPYAKFVNLESWKKCIGWLIGVIGGLFMVDYRYPGSINAGVSYFFPPKSDQFLIAAY